MCVGVGCVGVMCMLGMWGVFVDFPSLCFRLLSFLNFGYLSLSWPQCHLNLHFIFHPLAFSHKICFKAAYSLIKWVVLKENDTAHMVTPITMVGKIFFGVMKFKY